MHHAAVWIDHREARIFDVGTSSFTRSTLHAPRHPLEHRHPSAVEHEHPNDELHFFQDVAKSLHYADQILLLGPASAKLELMKHIEAHDRALVPKIVGVETVDHPTDGQLADYARKYFEHARFANRGSPDSQNAKAT